MKVMKVKNSLWVHFSGKVFCLKQAEKSAQDSGLEPSILEAPFTCKVLKVFAKKGLNLSKDDLVVMVEAMKMEFSYASPKNGTVEEVLVQEGQVIQSGQKFLRWKEA